MIIIFRGKSPRTRAGPTKQKKKQKPTKTITYPGGSFTMPIQVVLFTSWPY